jgi:aryl-alcohol dehydrogenase-like predicted oxidoreductase
MNLIDTAECYGDHLAEALIGGGIHQQREDWVVATKFGHQFHPEALRQAGRSPVQVRTDCWKPTEVVGQLEASLRALRTDHVDLYQMHSGSKELLGRHDLWEALNQEIGKGKVRHLGVSLGGDDIDRPGAPARSAPAWSRSATTASTRPPNRACCRPARTRNLG